MQGCLNVRRALAVLAIVAMTSVPVASAQDLEPRRYVNIPVRQNFLRIAAGYSTGEVDISPGLALEDAELDMSAASLAYLRTMDIGGKASSFDAFLPYMCADGNALNQGVRESRSVCGAGDARIRFSYNFVGARALPLDEFIKAEKTIVVGASVQVYLPIGQYDDDRILNIGANRWVIRPEVGLSIPAGKWNIEFSVGARFFQDNDEYLVDRTLSQDPLYNLQAHAVYDISPRQWLSLNGNYFVGGKTFVDDVRSQLDQENSRLGITWHIATDAFNVIQLTANSGVVTRVGNDSTTISIAWLHRWE